MSRKKLPDKKKVNIRGIFKFFKNVRAEMRKIVWPTRKQLVSYTTVVISASIIFAIMFFIYDSILGWLLKIFYLG